MHPILITIIQRLLLGLLTLFFVSIIIFSSIEFLPGDFTQAILGQAATEETVAAFRRELGLDQPAYMRYFDWIGAVLQGDFGSSFSGRNSSGVDRSRAVIDLVASSPWKHSFSSWHGSNNFNTFITNSWHNSRSIPQFNL